jgi:RNA polymerase sigma-70 factor (ECF subfamily)
MNTLRSSRDAESHYFARRKMNADASHCNTAKEINTGTDPLADVVVAGQQGDRGAQKQLYEACRQSVFSLAVRMVGLQDAADVTQMVFLRAFRSLAKFNGRSKFETWLYRLAVNESLQFLRRNRRWPHTPLEWEPMDSANHGDDVERRELLEQSLSRIAPDLRSIFLLREVEHLSYGQIAEVLEIPEGTVGSRLNRSRRELQERLAELGFES